MSKQKSFNQAIHNAELCQVLIENTQYPDWVITSAFYSAIHFVRYKIFPLSIPKTDDTQGLDIISTFEDYKRKFYPHNQVNPHQIILDLVKEHCRSILEDYKILKVLCHGARYDDYNVPKENVTIALECYSNIRAYCYPVEKKEEAKKVVG